VEVKLPPDLFIVINILNCLDYLRGLDGEYLVTEHFDKPRAVHPMWRICFYLVFSGELVK